METPDIYKEFLDRIVKHDYSFDYSDDHRVYSAGARSLDILREQAKQLVEIEKINPQTLLEVCLMIRKEQFTDGLTHKVIRGLFNKYV